MDNTKRKVEELMTAIDRIVDSRESKADLFGFDEEREGLKEKLGISTHNPQQVYNLFYGNIQSFLSNILPKDAAINRVKEELILGWHQMKIWRNLLIFFINGQKHQTTCLDWQIFY